MNSNPEAMPSLPQWRELRDPALLALCLLLIMAPTKFGAVVGAGGLPLYPENLVSWVWGIWPPFLASVLAGVVLAVTAWCRRRELPEWGWRAWLPVGPYLLILVGSLPGFLGTTEWATAVPLAWLFAGAAAMAVAVHLQVAARPGSRKWLILAVVLGGIWCVKGGIVQILWGFDEVQAHVETLIRSGQQVPSKLMNRVVQRRAFGTFTYPNNLAAHLALTMPLIAAVGWRAGRWFEPVKVSRWVLAVLLLGPTAWCFIATGSRGAGVGLAVAAVGVAILVARRRGVKQSKWAVALAAVLVVGAVGGIVAGGEARLSAIGARGDYYRAAVQMTMAEPLTGVGWGEFYPWYMRLKPPGAEETRMPHNFLLSFASQAGILGLLVALIWLAHPLLAGFWGERAGWLPAHYWHLPVAFGLLAWLAHAVADFNLMIPGTVLTVAAMTPLLVRRAVLEPEKEAKRTPLWLPALLAVVTIAGIWQLPGEKAFQETESALYRGNGDLARRLGAEAARLLPHSPHPDDLLARYALRSGDLDGAARYWRRAIERAPHRSGFHLRLAEVYLQSGQLAAAEEHLAAAKLWYPHSRNMAELAARLAESKADEAQ